MAVPAFNPSMTAQDLHLDANQLQQIITATANASSSMARLDGQLQGTAASLGSAMQSDAGKILYQRLGIWSQDYAQIKRNLDELNIRVTGMRNALIAANVGATGASQGGQ